ncbi:MAG: arsenic efflux protein [Bacteroidales bacterium]|nr:arsenic efflux protein [Bacteroidales bacterium]
MNIAEILIDALKSAVFITGMVVIMMMVIEVINISTRGRIFTGLQRTRLGQIVLSALLGWIPGCMGGFASVSLFSHGMISFGALVAMLIATMGDEAFVMLTLFPGKALLISAICLVTGILVGVIIDYLAPRLGLKPFALKACSHMELHDEDRPRLTWKLVINHLWNHVIVRHAARIFAWSLGVLILLGFITQVFDVSAWISSNTPLMIVLATLIGIIPESGPHMIFVTLFASGVVPFPVLIASCISQDGHASLPLLAESKGAFLRAKAINCAVALIVGFLCTGIM